MQLKLQVRKESVRLFIQDLWKDLRHLEVIDCNGGKIIRRFADNNTTIAEEFEYLGRLGDIIDFKIPEIFQYTDTYIDFRYIQGTRAFNLLMDLKSLYQLEKNARYLKLGLKLITLLQNDLTVFQTEMMADPFFTVNRPVYPAGEKIRTLYRVLTSV
ncbi:MAG: hypothetical protein HQ517_01660, partial [SAR324 cluster bacterium]|nr:hypothetical protein [SAR324 cluster bacterium]